MSLYKKERSVKLYESYRENKEFAKKIKERWQKPVDPILQRGSQYIQIEKPIQQCKLNYFQRMKQKEYQPKPKGIHSNYSTLYRESKNNNTSSRKKIFSPEQMKPKLRTMENQHIRIYPEQYAKSKIAMLISHTEDNNTMNVKNNRKVYSPSEEYTKMNNKKNMLPSENKSTKNLLNRRQLNNKDGIKETKERVFNVGLSARSYSTPKIKWVNKIEEKEKTDHINDLISYRYGPSFREDKFTEKPNKTSFNFIVNNTIENLHQNYIHKVYN